MANSACSDEHSASDSGYLMETEGGFAGGIQQPALRIEHETLLEFKARDGYFLSSDQLERLSGTASRGADGMTYIFKPIGGSKNVSAEFRISEGSLTDSQLDLLDELLLTARNREKP